MTAKQLLDLPAIRAFDAAMDGDHGRRIAEQSADPLLQIRQRVALLGEDDQVALAPRGITHLRGVRESPILHRADGRGRAAGGKTALLAGRKRAAAEIRMSLDAMMAQRDLAEAL